MLRALTLLSSLLLVLGCKPDRCRGEAPAFQRDVVLPGGVDGSWVTMLGVSVDATGLHKEMNLPISGQLAKGRTTVAVDVGARGRDGFSADVSVEARDATGRVLARGQQRFTGSGDACNVFSLALAGGSDGPVAVDRGPDVPPVKPPDHAWSKRLGATIYGQGWSVAVDASGAVFLAGAFQGKMGLCGMNYAADSVNAIVVASYDSSGKCRWGAVLGEAIGASGPSAARGVAVDKSGNVLLTGLFGGRLSPGLDSAGDSDVFVASYTSAGGYRWAKTFGGTSADGGLAVAVDGNGGAVVTGDFCGAAAFGGGTLTSAGLSDIFVASLDANGTPVRYGRYGAGGEDHGYAVAVDASGRVSVTGAFTGTVDFGNGSSLTSNGDNLDAFIASYDATTSQLHWVRSFGGVPDDVGRGIAVDKAGNVTVTGHFQGMIDVDGKQLSSIGSSDVFIVSYEPGGQLRWARSFGGTGAGADDSGLGVAVDASGNVVVTGSFRGTANPGGGPLASAGGSDIFVASYTSTGAFRWAKRFGGAGDEQGAAVAVDLSGNVLVTGGFSGTVDFGGGPLASAGATDAFLLKLTP